MKPIRVLFVCAGNICRSPIAEAVFLGKVKAAGLENEIQVDSAGTGNWHTGEQPNKRAIHELQQHGLKWVSTARQVTESDFSEFDYVVGLDLANVRDLTDLAGPHQSKVKLLMEWAGEGELEVPDPYYGTQADFEIVYEMAERASDRILAELSASLAS